MEHGQIAVDSLVPVVSSQCCLNAVNAQYFPTREAVGGPYESAPPLQAPSQIAIEPLMM